MQSLVPAALGLVMGNIVKLRVSSECCEDLMTAEAQRDHRAVDPLCWAWFPLQVNTPRATVGLRLSWLISGFWASGILKMQGQVRASFKGAPGKTQKLILMSTARKY